MISMPSTTPQLLLAEEYLVNAIQAVQKAKNHIYLLTMIITNDEVIEPLIDALVEASKRGVTVNVAADIFTYAEIGGHFKLNTQHSPRTKPATTLKKRLQKAGVAFRWLGRSSTSILNGRTHCKWLVVDDTVFSFGGVNLFAGGIKSNDFMFKLVDADLAQILIDAQTRIIKADRNNRLQHSRKKPISVGTLYLDGGILGDSMIYRRACALTKKSESVVYVSQYCPTGRLGRLLKQTNNKLYFNHWNKTTSINALTIRIGSFLSGHQTLYNRAKYLHAKVIIFKLHDGKKVALTGSHNFSHGGVWLGTRENTVETDDPKIISQLERFIEEHVA